ncbi:Rossmann-like and DUF2520 domain-containing protein [Flavobacterium lacus]|jgi:predicted short-subunit dehydrogenase-like oxidoreductase (DUF2520 family)|uniref:Putative short-subunit dehydrogenase-like oxidoreductase (DUF2520 family) n=1 Tax=Flavobacterium lacus TaxID=1353778 RepID=A0A328WUA7_9FLAO|nr:Rossmann-like and DUF2520 domain-containing protein [Flavobacterium lacus]RAR46958.1 putative short-subunit dehydrogenase-like oxidoreductase (DUF2520 family) [Flavobacterium lacus]
MVSIVIIGSGNVAQHLITAFLQSDEIELIQVFSRQKESVSHLISLDKIVSDYDEIKEAAIYIIAVSDNAIGEVSSKLPFENRLVVHTSGSMPIEILDSKNRRGVFYPLQTFTKNKAINFKEIPICLESELADDFMRIEKLAKSISNSVQSISSEQRKALHVAAVFVCNFVNHLYKIGNDICVENQLSFEILKPLIVETAQKIIQLSPENAQTGPAKRNDTETINSHLNFISDENQKEIYKLLTKSIIDHGKKL